MEYQQALVRAPRMSRVNWTQTTTITIAAFLGCLGAMALLFFLYRSFLGKSIRERMFKLDLLDSQINESEEDLQDLNIRIDSARRRAPNPTPTPIKVDSEKDEENEELQTKPEEPKGEPIPTIPVV